MPPICTGSSPKSTNQEDKILLVFNNIKNGRIKSIYTAAKLYKILYTTLYIHSYSRLIFFLLCAVAILYLLLERIGYQSLLTVVLNFVYIFCEDIIINEF
ncbi:hypothetical protein N7450_010087 [Penicillium hetheringtonii]|uniref:Uncharacterized protein n=1 Tax=Penicillium hetheringtonii TaxID=911720 RepID=A0AAD6DC48_9EURO|nr:hypothetical protein N7450_010087 [Penicillium hetheringtonii]